MTTYRTCVNNATSSCTQYVC